MNITLHLNDQSICNNIQILSSSFAYLSDVDATPSNVIDVPRINSEDTPYKKAFSCNPNSYESLSICIPSRSAPAALLLSECKRGTMKSEIKLTGIGQELVLSLCALPETGCFVIKQEEKRSIALDQIGGAMRY